MVETFRGKVKWFSKRKGKGEITDMVGERVDFSVDQLMTENETIRKGENVVFEVAYDWDQNLFAINVRREKSAK